MSQDAIFPNIKKQIKDHHEEMINDWQGEYGKDMRAVAVCTLLDSSGIRNDKHIRYIIMKNWYMVSVW